MIYVDSARNSFRRMIMCHMIADTPEELHAMALAVGMRLDWYQGPPDCSFPHYDLSLTRRREALRLGAQEISRRELAEKMRELRNLFPENWESWRPQ